MALYVRACPGNPRQNPQKEKKALCLVVDGCSDNLCRGTGGGGEGGGQKAILLINLCATSLQIKSTPDGTGSARQRNQ